MSIERTCETCAWSFGRLKGQSALRLRCANPKVLKIVGERPFTAVLTARGTNACPPHARNFWEERG